MLSGLSAGTGRSAHAAVDDEMGDVNALGE
jgi:hypothetical protein